MPSSSTPDPSPGDSQSVDVTPELVWTGVVTVLMLVQVALPGFFPQWFSADPEQLAGRGVLGIHFVFIVALLAQWPWARWATLGYLTLALGIWVAKAPALLPPDPSPLAPYRPAWAIVFLCHVGALALLAFAPPVKRYFR